MLQVTLEKIEKLHELTRATDAAKNVASELLRVAQDRHNNDKHKLEREGKEIELTEKVLWQEVFYIGRDSQAGQVLRKKHQDVFDAYTDQNVKAEELNKFVMQSFGLDYKHMAISDYFNMIEAIVDFKLKEYGIIEVTETPEGEVKASL